MCNYGNNKISKYLPYLRIYIIVYKLILILLLSKIIDSTRHFSIFSKLDGHKF